MILALPRRYRVTVLAGWLPKTIASDTPSCRDSLDPRIASGRPMLAQEASRACARLNTALPISCRHASVTVTCCIPDAATRVRGPLIFVAGVVTMASFRQILAVGTQPIRLPRSGSMVRAAMQSFTWILQDTEAALSAIGLVCPVPA